MAGFKDTKDKLKAVLRLGLTAGLQSSVFSISNVLIQSSVNSFGSMAMAGNTAASNLESFIYTSMNSIYQANLSFTSQNVGAHKYNNINRILVRCIVLVVCIGAVMGALALTFHSQLLGIYSSDPEVAAYGIKRMAVICSTYYLCGTMDTLVGSMRGMGYSMLPMLVSLAGACGFRIVWIFTIFAWNHSLESLYISYPISWGLTAAVHLACFIVLKRKHYS